MSYNQTRSLASPAKPPADVLSDDASPVFLVGATRSGTTLLRLMLNHHPEICNFGEFEYAVKWYVGNTPPEIDAYRRKLTLDRVFRKHGWAVDNGLDYIGLVRSFLHQAAAGQQKPIAGATVHSRFDRLTDIWPAARFIHLIRDPRDVSRSSIEMGWVGNVWYGSEHWLQPVERWRQLRARVPEDRRIEVRFEELIQDCTGELSRICEFVGTEYDPAMLHYAENSNYDLPDPNLVNQWQKRLSREELQWVEAVCHRQMTEFGYRPVSEDLTPPGPWTTLKLFGQHRLSRIQRNIRRYGLPLYFSWQLAKRMPYSGWKRRILRKVDELDTARLK